MTPPALPSCEMREGEASLADTAYSAEMFQPANSLSLSLTSPTLFFPSFFSATLKDGIQLDWEKDFTKRREDFWDFNYLIKFDFT